MRRPAFGLCLKCDKYYARDGDTVVISLAGSDREWIIRLLEIDCPEARDPGGPEAKSFTAKMLREAKEVAVWIPATKDYQRLLKDLTFGHIPGHIFVDTEKTLSQHLKEAGHFKASAG